MKLRYKVLLGAAAVAVASAASSPNQFGLGPASWQQREALSMCQRTNASFVSFLASERDSCYSQFRSAVDERTGLWSRHDRGPRQLAETTR
jgi:hypothetical protein